MPTVALVGYTNAGKTTLFNVLADRRRGVRCLFVTLDPLVQQVRLGDSRDLLVSDTVRFIDRLPHALVAAFRATLEEVARPTLFFVSTQGPRSRSANEGGAAGARSRSHRRPARRSAAEVRRHFAR